MPNLSLTTKIVVAALTLTLIVHGGTTAYVFYRQIAARSQTAPPVADQIGALASLLRDAGPEEERTVLRALNSPYLIVRRLDGAEDERRGLISRTFGAYLAHAARRADELETVRITASFPTRAETGDALTAPHLPVDQTVMRFVLETEDGRRYLVITDSPFLSLGMISRQFGNTLFLILLVVAAALFLIRRIVAPLQRFSEAADRLRNDIDAPPLDEGEGVAEVRSAARSFNQMQSRLQELVSERTHMLAAISHDMRTLVTRWGLRAENIADPELRARAAADVAELNGLISQFLDFARSSSDEISMRKINLSSVVQSVCDEFAESESDVACECEAQGVVMADLVALKRIVRNLVGNAVRYGERARVRIEREGGSVRLIVCDDGVGLPEEAFEEVFRPYARMETSRSRDTGGAGLGLAIVKNLCERHEAEIGLSNLEGAGLCVVVTFPAAPQAGSASGA